MISTPHAPQVVIRDTARGTANPSAITAELVNQNAGIPAFQAYTLDLLQPTEPLSIIAGMLIVGEFISHTLRLERLEASVPLRSLDRATQNYQQGLISLGRAAEIAGLPYDKMIEELARRSIPLSFGPASVEEAEHEERQFLEWRQRSSE